MQQKPAQSLARRLAARVTAGAAAVTLALTAATGTASAETVVSGSVECANNMVSGVWIEAESSTSGWASWEMPLELGGLTKANYSFTLDRDGRYEVHVGCGGSSESWAHVAESEMVSGNNTFACNDIPWWLQAVGSWAFSKAGLKGISFHDLPAYGTCKTI